MCDAYVLSLAMIFAVLDAFNLLSYYAQYYAVKPTAVLAVCDHL